MISYMTALLAPEKRGGCPLPVRTQLRCVICSCKLQIATVSVSQALVLLAFPYCGKLNKNACSNDFCCSWTASVRLAACSFLQPSRCSLGRTNQNLNPTNIHNCFLTV